MGRAAYGNLDTHRMLVLKGSKIIVQIRKIPHITYPSPRWGEG